MKRYYPLFFLGLVLIMFFSKFLFLGHLPIPSDTIIGLYHPYRDLYASTNPQGIAYKNFLITDPVRQQYPWRVLAITALQQGNVPLWNPYSFAGTPLAANFQTAAFYPLNMLFFLLPFSFAWSGLVFLQPLLGMIFMFHYLRYFKLKTEAAILGALVFAFSGVSVAWMEWGTIMQTGLWLPLVLLSIDKIVFYHSQNKNIQYPISNLKYPIKTFVGWSFIYIFSLTAAFFAGHLQTFFYLLIVSFLYLVVRLWQHRDEKKLFGVFAWSLLLFGLTTAIQWIPTVQFLLLSARNVDQADWHIAGWFLPWQHLVQFIAPDFFGNPATLNYWGVWNYGEFVGYIGIIPLLFAFYALFFRRDKKVLFATLLVGISFLFALPTGISQIPFLLQIPFLSSSQPTRLLFLVDFGLAFLAACGLDLFLRGGKKIFLPLSLLVIVLGGVWLFVLGIIPGASVIASENLLTAKRNLYLPTILVMSSFIVFLPLLLKKNMWVKHVVVIIIIGITLFDLFRFFDKFTPFTKQEYLFPLTKTLSFLQQQPKPFRIMATDSRIFPPNFSSIYQLETIEGYDPLYLQRYGELVIASERNKPDISGPFGFNRIITPHNYDSKIIDLLNVKYVLSLSDISSPKLKKVFQEGQTHVYENMKVLPRAFAVEKIVIAATRQEAIKQLFLLDLSNQAVVEDEINNLSENQFGEGNINSFATSPNTVTLHVSCSNRCFFVLTDTYYPTWKVKIDEKEDKLYRTDYNFRGVVVPAGEHTITYTVGLL